MSLCYNGWKQLARPHFWTSFDPPPSTNAHEASIQWHWHTSPKTVCHAKSRESFAASPPENRRPVGRLEMRHDSSYPVFPLWFLRCLQVAWWEAGLHRRYQRHLIRFHHLRFQNLRQSKNRHRLWREFLVSFSFCLCFGSEKSRWTSLVICECFHRCHSYCYFVFRRVWELFVIHVLKARWFYLLFICNHHRNDAKQAIRGQWIETSGISFIRCFSRAC